MKTEEDNWTPTTETEIIAVAIGHHFWQCESDKHACSCGMDAARDVVAAISESTQGDARQPDMSAVHFCECDAMWAERRLARDGRICNCEDAPCCGHYDG